MSKADVVSELVNITLRYDMVVVQEIKIDQTVPYDFLDAINSASNETYAMALSERSGQQEDDQEDKNSMHSTIEHRISSWILPGYTTIQSWMNFKGTVHFIVQTPLTKWNSARRYDIHHSTYKPANAVNETAALHHVVETFKQIQPNPTSSFLVISMQIAVMLRPMN